MELFLVAAVSLSLLEQHVLDSVIEQELAAEVAQLLAKELVELFHDWGQDANAVSPD